MSNALQQLKLGSEQLASTVKSKLEGGLGAAQEFIRINPVTSGVTIGGGLLAGAGLIATQVFKKKSKRVSGAPRKRAKAVSKKRVGKRSRHSWRMDQLKISKEKHEVAYQKRKKKLSGRKSKKKIGKIYYTKKGQPYKIKRDGKAIFIKKTKRRSR